MSLIGSSAFIMTAVMAVWAAVGADSRLSGYAAERAPVYGSGERAVKAGNIFMYASVGAAAVIYTVRYFDEFENIGAAVDGYYGIAAPPAWDNAYRYAANRPADYPARISAGGQAAAPGRPLSAAEAAGALALSGAAASTATEILKKQIGRPRPDLSDNLSYPSGHVTTAALANRGSALMLNGLGLSPRVKYTADAALTLLTAGAAWGRIEGGRHYASDVMAGAWVGMALTDASFALFRTAGDDCAGGIRFGIRTYNENGSATTVLSTSVDF